MNSSASNDDFRDQLKVLGHTIRKLRKELGVSQEELAHTAQIDRSHMGKIERGERNVSIVNLIRICVALRCNLSDLFIHAGL